MRTDTDTTLSPFQSLLHIRACSFHKQYYSWVAKEGEKEGRNMLLIVLYRSDRHFIHTSTMQLTINNTAFLRRTIDNVTYLLTLVLKGLLVKCSTGFWSL
eukprot:sb/3478704/